MQKSETNSPRRRNVSGLIIVAGFSLAALASFSIENLRSALPSTHSTVELIGADAALTPLPPRRLTEADKAAAVRAWNYFEANTRPNTGFVDSVSGFPSTTLWDLGSYLFGVVAATRLGIISDDDARIRLSKTLDSLRTLPLFDDKLPNKAYNTITLEKTNYENVALKNGIGWSALDLGRLLAALRAVSKFHPELMPEIFEVTARWDLAEFARSGELWGYVVEGEKGNRLQEGRIGYEQYAARAAALWGLDVSHAIRLGAKLKWEVVNGISVPTDQRTAKIYNAITPVLSEPYLLQAFELGLTHDEKLFAARIYRAQEARFTMTGKPTMVSEDHLDGEISFAYSSVYSNGQDWAVVDEAGNFYPDLRTLSTKATIGWDALYETSYTKQMRAKLDTLEDAQLGWQAGIYEESGVANAAYSLNTNAIILEAIHYKAFGPFLANTPRSTTK